MPIATCDPPLETNVMNHARQPTISAVFGPGPSRGPDGSVGPDDEDAEQKTHDHEISDRAAADGWQIAGCERLFERGARSFRRY
jgi:hypothetical protein